MIENGVLNLFKVRDAPAIQLPQGLRQDVKTVLCSPSVDDSSTITKEMIREEWRNLILSAWEMIRDGDDSMDGATVLSPVASSMASSTMDNATGDDATDNATVEVDEVLDKRLEMPLRRTTVCQLETSTQQSFPRLSSKRTPLLRCQARRTIPSAKLSCVFNGSSVTIPFRTSSSR